MYRDVDGVRAMLIVCYQSQNVWVVEADAFIAAKLLNGISIILHRS